MENVSPDTLKKVYLFQDFNDSELGRVAKICQVRAYKPGETVFKQSDPAHSLYLIKSGAIRILQKATNGDWVEIATLGPASHFGEMPLIDGESRSANAEAYEASVVLEFPYEKIRDVLGQNPGSAAKFYLAISKFLCGRLRATTSDLSFAKELNIRHF